MTARTGAEAEPAYLLHQRPYRNTSQLLEVLTLGHGRVGLVAQGSRRPGRGTRALLQPFIPLKLSWTRRGELGKLTDVEAGSGALALAGNALLAGYYVNELMITLTSRDDPTAQLFAHYAQCLGELAAGDSSIARVLRLFEFRLLNELGFGLQLDVDCASGEPLLPDHKYLFSFDTIEEPADQLLLR